MQVRRLRASDATASFACGDAGLDRFLQRHAWQNQDALGIGVTYVATPGSEIAGYVTLTAGTLERDVVPADPAAAYPRYPLPVVRLARLAVDTRVQGVGIGSALVGFVLRVAWTMREQVGCVGVVVDALPAAVAYYEALGFVPLTVLRGSSTARPRQVPLYLSLHEARPLLETD
jgi:predicted N-acetyltransferase YhbS